MAGQYKRSKSSHSSLIPRAKDVVRFLEQCPLVKKYTIGFIDGRRRGNKKELRVATLGGGACQLKVCSDGAVQILVVSLHGGASMEDFHAALRQKLEDDFCVIVK
ncbi:MAG: hypothetical protein PHT88_02530 [Candidatus Moranbacteria bacterium]|nr:hypothetical protein [Candidatus Moranbacteria bacterium]